MSFKHANYSQRLEKLFLKFYNGNISISVKYSKRQSNIHIHLDVSLLSIKSFSHIFSRKFVVQNMM